MLLGCDKAISIEDVTTFEEKIENEKIEIDGVTYDIDNSYVYTYLYNDDKLVERRIERNNGNGSTKYHYDKNLINKEEHYSNGQLRITKYYTYDKDKEVETKTIMENSDNSIITKTEYGNNSKKVYYYDSNNKLSSVENYELNDDGDFISLVSMSNEGDTFGRSEFAYEDDKMIYAKLIRDSGVTREYHYEYNNLGDLISEYQISRGEKNRLFAFFYDNEYDEKLRLIRQIKYEVFSEIDEEIIRTY